MQTDEIQDADEFAKPRTTTLAHKSKKQRDNEMQMHILRCLENSGQAGATNRDLVKYLQTHFEEGNEFLQSPTSGATSRMHRDGLIVRTSQRRDGFVVYVHPDHVPADAVIVQPRKKKEDEMFGTKKATDTRGEVEALQQQLRERDSDIGRLRDERDRARNGERLALRQRDEALDVITRVNQDVGATERDMVRLTNERDESRADVGRLESENLDLRTSVGELRARLDQAEVETTPAPQAPRKTFTTDERRLVQGVAKLLRDRYPSNGTPDNPTRVTLKVSTVRSIVNGALRVVGD